MENTISKESQVVQAVKKLSKDLKKIKSDKGGLTTSLSTGARKRLADIVANIDHSIKDTPLSWVPAKEKLFTTIGIEYTFLKRKKVKMTEEEIVKKVIALSDKRQPWNKKVHQDGTNVIEFASPAHKTWKDLLNTYRVTVATAKKVGLATKRHDEGSGGGHIHLGIPKHWHTNFRLKFLKVLYLDLSSRPYLNWIFNEPIDDKNASSLLTSRDGIRLLKKLDYKAYINLNDVDDISGKSFGVRYDGDYDTVEFRIFDMVESEQMLEEYIEFVNAYFRYIYNIVKNNYYSIEYGISYYNISNKTLDKFREKKNVVSDFNKLLKDLGLNPSKYKKYITKNYDARIKLSQSGKVKMDYDALTEIDLSTIDEDRIKCDRDYDFGEVCVPSGDDEENIKSNISLIAKLDENGQLVFENVDMNKKEQETEIFHRWSGGDTLDANGNSQMNITESCIATSESILPSILVNESMSGNRKYILGPGKSKMIGDAPVTNTSSDKFLVVTRFNDESLDFNYLSTPNNVVPVPEPVSETSEEMTRESANEMIEIIG